MDVGSRRIIAECRFATVTDRDIHFYRHQNDAGIQEALRLREVVSIRCEYQQRPFLAAMFVVLAVACIALAVRTLLAGGPALSTTVASVGGAAFGMFCLWLAIWQSGFFRVVAVAKDATEHRIGVAPAWNASTAEVVVSAVQSRLGGYEYSGPCHLGECACHRAADVGKARTSSGRNSGTNSP